MKSERALTLCSKKGTLCFFAITFPNVDGFEQKLHRSVWRSYRQKTQGSRLYETWCTSICPDLNYWRE